MDRVPFDPANLKISGVVYRIRWIELLGSIIF